MPMNIARTSSSGMIASVSAVTPPSSDEYVFQSRLTACTSPAVVTDQNPASSGYSVIRDVQWTGHSARSRLNSSCGGPSCHSSRSVTSTSSREVASTDTGASGSGRTTLPTLPGGRRQRQGSRARRGEKFTGFFATHRPRDRTYGLASLAKLDSRQPRVRPAVRGRVGHGNPDVGLAIPAELSPRIGRGADPDCGRARGLGVYPDPLDPLSPDHEVPWTRDLHREARRPPPAVALERAEVEQVADAGGAAGLAEAPDAAAPNVRDVDRAASVCSDRRGEQQCTGASPRAAPLAARGAGADLEVLTAAWDDVEAEGTDKRAIGRELAHPAVAGVGDVDVARRIGADTQHEVTQLSGASARDAPLEARGLGAGLESPAASRDDIEAEGAHEGALRRELAQ